MNIKLSSCQTFLEIDDMKFMASSSVTVDESSCTHCYFDDRAFTSVICNLDYCMKSYRNDKTNIIWMRIL